MPRAKKIDLEAFAEELLSIQRQVPFKISARGWCYQLESFGAITKAEFDTVERHINQCRSKGLLPIDFVAEEDARRFSGVEEPMEESPISYMGAVLRGAMLCEEYYTPNWWDGEEYYIQMVVEKVDLKTLFSPICEEYHIPIATSKGWSSMLQRAEYARRFREAEDKGMTAVLLYCGDHDGLRISEFLRKNLMELSQVTWLDGTLGYDPSNLKIDSFGLNYDFITENNLTWIDNLITGSGNDLADPSHPNHHLRYVQDYLRQFGPRKCEANALVVIPDVAQQLCRDAIESYLGNDALSRFAARYQMVCDQLDEFRDRTGLRDTIQEVLEQIKEAE